MDYNQVSFTNDSSLNDAIIAWLAEVGFTMFEEKPEGVQAFIDSGEFDENKLNDALSHISGRENIHYEVSFIKDQNWNKVWESNFEPVLVNGRVYIRAPFHDEGKEFQYQITIEPKMSFGTGHHATTALIIELMLQFEFKDKEVLDMGCGTSVLSILAEKFGAKSILAIDNDEWAYQNSIENVKRNGCNRIEVIKGDVSAIKNRTFDVILANINRNVLLSDMKEYVNSLNKGGELYMSGILVEDKNIIRSTATESGLNYITEASRNNWLALFFKKN